MRRFLLPLLLTIALVAAIQPPSAADSARLGMWQAEDGEAWPGGGAALWAADDAERGCFALVSSEAEDLDRGPEREAAPRFLPVPVLVALAAPLPSGAEGPLFPTGPPAGA